MQMDSLYDQLAVVVRKNKSSDNVAVVDDFNIEVFAA